MRHAAGRLRPSTLREGRAWLGSGLALRPDMVHPAGRVRPSTLHEGRAWLGSGPALRPA